MNKILFLGLLFTANYALSQVKPKQFGGEFKLQSAQSECLSDSHRQEIQSEIQKSRESLVEKGILNNNVLQRNAQDALLHPLFIWPVVKNPAAPYNNVWSISNHVDHNPGFPNQVLDYNCGTRTYDTSDGYNHMGIDIFTWPFSWYQFQNNHAWVVAAADGVIIYKSDGHFDMNCSLNGTNWNAVYIEHADGSVSWYGHLKNASLTTKAVGESVVAGEFLGVVGSSGNSTGPHLHFEVYNAFNQLVDPYIGTCNNWGSSNDSWWQVQKPYMDSKINAVLTHNLPPVFNTCPNTETVNLKNNFNTGENVVIAIYLADQLQGTSGVISLTRPNGMSVYTDVVNFSDNYTASYWYWNFPSTWFNQSGNWNFSFTYQGNTVTHTFSYGTLDNEKFAADLFVVYPNPTNDILNIRSNSNTRIDEVLLFDVTGKQVHGNTNSNSMVDVSMLTKGVYMMKIISEEGIYTHKVIKN